MLDYKKLNHISKKIIKLLINQYGKDISLYLNYHKNKKYEFLFAVMLSAQSTDKIVNDVTNILYKKYKSLIDFCNLNIKDLENDIYRTGFYHNKAKNIIKTAQILYYNYKCKVPNSYDELIKLPGVGRKTANVVLSTLFGIQSMAVDTHVFRISNRLFNLNEHRVDKVCDILEKIIDINFWHLWNTHLILLGRTICKARNFKCTDCFLNKYCEYYNHNII